MYELILVLEQFAVQVLLHEREHPLQQRVERRLIGADRGDAELGALKQILVADLGARHFKFRADPCLEAPDDHPLFLEAATARQMEIEDRISDDHKSAVSDELPAISA